MRGRGGQASSCLNWWVLRTSPLKLASHIRDPGRAQYSRGGCPTNNPLFWGKKQAPYSPSRSLFPTRQNFSLKVKKADRSWTAEIIPQSSLPNDKSIKDGAVLTLTSLCHRGSSGSGMIQSNGRLGNQAVPLWSPLWWQSEQGRLQMPTPVHK